MLAGHRVKGQNDELADERDGVVGVSFLAASAVSGALTSSD